MITYLRELYTFSAGQVLELIQQSITSSQISADKTRFRNDLTEGTCMLVMDGLDYTFSHRSFQEYFAAYFLSRVKVDELTRAVPKLVQRSTFDNVLKMISEMNNEKFEEGWALPTLDLLCDAVNGINAKEHSIQFAGRLISGRPQLALQFPRSNRERFQFRIRFLNESEDSRRNSQRSGGQKRARVNITELRGALYRVYNLFDKINAQIKSAKFADDDIYQKIHTGRILKDDSRFDRLRKSSAQAGNIVHIDLTDKDSEWLRGTWFACFISAESELLPRLRDEIEERVRRRKEGLAEILPL